jgi:hypothetical protein
MVKNFVLAPGDATLVECHFWGNGVVGLSADMQLFVYEVNFPPPFSSFPSRSLIASHVGSHQCRWRYHNSKIFSQLWIEFQETLHFHGNCPSPLIKIWIIRGLIDLLVPSVVSVGLICVGDSRHTRP